MYQRSLTKSYIKYINNNTLMLLGAKSESIRVDIGLFCS